MLQKARCHHTKQMLVSCAKLTVILVPPDVNSISATPCLGWLVLRNGVQSSVVISWRTGSWTVSLCSPNSAVQLSRRQWVC